MKPPKHRIDCRGQEDLLLGNAFACRACEWYERVERLVDAAEVLAESASMIGFPANISGIDRTRDAIRALKLGSV